MMQRKQEGPQLIAGTDVMRARGSSDLHMSIVRESDAKIDIQYFAYIITCQWQNSQIQIMYCSTSTTSRVVARMSHR